MLPEVSSVKSHQCWVLELMLQEERLRENVFQPGKAKATRVPQGIKT